MAVGSEGAAPVENRATIVFDGRCAFCRRQIEWIRSRDRHGCFEFMPAQDAQLPARFPQLAAHELSAGLRVVRSDGRVFVGADGVEQIVRRLPRWRMLAFLFRLPGGRLVARVVYRWIAANRERLDRGTDACTAESGEAERPTPPPRRD